MMRSAPQAPPAPAGFDPNALFQGIFWYQRWEVFENVFTPGPNPIEQMCADMGLPRDLSGKRVLDIGAWNGCLSFECERRGAREVVALSPEDPELTGFCRIRNAIGSRRTQYVVGSVYNLNPEELGYFDVVLFCGVLYHLRYPLLGIDNIRRVCQGDVFIESFVTDLQFIVQPHARLLKPSPPIEEVPLAKIAPVLLSVPLWQFFRRDELKRDSSNWFGPNTAAVVQAFESAGFETTLLKTQMFGDCCRATFHARLREEPPEFLTLVSAEGLYYDTVVGHLFGAQRLGFGPASPLEWALVNQLASDARVQIGGDLRAWIAELYVRLLGRRAAAEELDDAVRRMRDGAAGHRRALVAALLQRKECRALIIRECYSTFLGRSPDDSEVDSWVAQMEDGAPPERVVACFVCSEEYFAKHGGSSRQWLYTVHRQLLGREPDRAARAVADALENGAAQRDTVAVALTERPDCREHLLGTLYRRCFEPADEPVVRVPLLGSCR